MQPLFWSDDFVTGLKDLDAANESLFFLLTHLCDQGVECDGKACLGNSTCQKVDALVSFVTRNMAAEEAVMERWRYPARDAHAKDHNYVVTRLLEWRRVSICRMPATAAFCSFIQGWTTKHVLGFDRAFGRWAANAAYGPEAAALPATEWLPSTQGSADSCWLKLHQQAPLR